MGNFFKIFNDDNNINEKAIIGFISFAVMIGFAVMDIIAAYKGKSLLVNEFIFNSFLIITLGSLGIASIDKYINKNSETSDSE
jgi:hypothetical protein